MFRIYRIPPGRIRVFHSPVKIRWAHLRPMFTFNDCTYANFAAICNLVCNAYCTAALNKCHCNNNEIPCALEFRSHVHR